MNNAPVERVVATALIAELAKGALHIYRVTLLQRPAHSTNISTQNIQQHAKVWKNSTMPHMLAARDLSCSAHDTTRKSVHDVYTVSIPAGDGWGEVYQLNKGGS